MGRQIGYARVSTDDLHGKAQKAALEAVPCDLVFFEQESGANRERPELARTIRTLRPGDTLVVARLEPEPIRLRGIIRAANRDRAALEGSVE